MRDPTMPPARYGTILSTPVQPIDTTTEIETPEHVRFRHRVAGPARRVLAYVLDALVRGTAVFVVVVVAAVGGLLSGGELAAASQGLVLLMLFVVDWLYFVFFETVMSGRSPGKAALRLRVVTITGEPLRISDSMLRNLLRAADFLPTLYALGLVVMGRDPQFRRLGDMVAGTMVVVEEAHRVEGPVYIHPPPSPQELHWLPERIPLDAEDLDAIELLLRRAATLSHARSMELAELVAPIYAARLGVRPHDPYRFLALLYHRARGHAYAAPGGYGRAFAR